MSSSRKWRSIFRRRDRSISINNVSINNNNNIITNNNIIINNNNKIDNVSINANDNNKNAVLAPSFDAGTLNKKNNKQT